MAETPRFPGTVGGIPQLRLRESFDQPCRPGLCCRLETFRFSVRFRRFRLVRGLPPLIVVFCWLSAFASGMTSLSAADVEVRLTDGRTLRGSVIEDRTNPERLALEQRSSGLVIQRTLSWKQIADVRVVAAQKREIREVVPSPPGPMAIERRRSEPLPLSQLLVSAEPISTRGRMDWDSLRLQLRGVDIKGETVPLFGTLKVNLWGQRRVSPESNFVRQPFVTDANYGSRFLAGSSNSSAYQHPYVTAPNPVVELASWTQAINDEQQEDLLVLPLPSPLPEHDVRVGSIGEVSVELLMPGVGVFAASAPDVVLSHQSALRRARLDRDGSRFFPNESTTDSPQTTRSRQRFTWPGGVSGPERGILPIQP